jgi:hypothetical protein
MQARRGLSLTEVLIAIFVMAIGMIALLVLFPLGMLNMAWALKNNRISQAVGGANSIAELPNANAIGQRFSLRDDGWYQSEIQGSPAAGTPYPDLGTWNTTALPPVWNWNFAWASPATPMVVFVDPIGEAALGAPTRPGNYVGGYNPFAIPNLGLQVGVPRVSTSQTSKNPIAARNWCSQEDDVTFNGDGSATVDPLTPFVERGRRYSWAYVCRWPRFTDSSVVEMSVPVYSARPAPLPLPGAQVSTELSYRGGGGFPPPATPPAWWQMLAFAQGSTTAKVLLPQQQAGASLPIKRGDWIFDNTLIIPPMAGTPPQPQPIPLANGYFYKVIGISDAYQNANGWVQDLQLDRPAKNFGFAVVVLKGLADVKEKSDGRMPVK